MSEDLKTLKEIETKGCPDAYTRSSCETIEDHRESAYADGWCVAECALREALRAEAIKWVKHYTKIKADDSDKQIYTIQEHQELFINWIMHFFNIKESELK